MRASIARRMQPSDMSLEKTNVSSGIKHECHGSIRVGTVQFPQMGGPRALRSRLDDVAVLARIMDLWIWTFEGYTKVASRSE
jgi:hypothetical protein